MLDITSKKYRHWRIKSLVITNNDDYYADEILHYVLQQINKKLSKYPDFEVTDNYVFISLKNAYFNMLRKEETLLKNKKKYFNYQTEYSDGLDINYEDYEIKMGEDSIIQTKLECINYVYEKILDPFEQKIFYLNLIKGLSQREISKQSGLSLQVVNYRIKLIKNKIKDYYGTKRK
jgi:RNA polymerase sigma factor (sigma-70 family)